MRQLPRTLLIQNLLALALERVDPLIDRMAGAPLEVCDVEEIVQLSVRQLSHPIRQKLATVFADHRMVERARQRLRDVRDTTPWVGPYGRTRPLVEVHAAGRIPIE